MVPGINTGSAPPLSEVAFSTTPRLSFKDMLCNRLLSARAMNAPHRWENVRRTERRRATNDVRVYIYRSGAAGLSRDLFATATFLVISSSSSSLSTDDVTVSAR